jgi:hypothetical protein
MKNMIENAGLLQDLSIDDMISIDGGKQITWIKPDGTIIIISV